MATYSTTAVFNAAAFNLEKKVEQLSQEMNIPIVLMPLILDKVKADILSYTINDLSTDSINLTNEIEELKSKLPPEPKNTKEGKTEET